VTEYLKEVLMDNAVRLIFHAKEDCFKIGEVEVDRVEGFDQYEGGRLTIFRNGEVFDQTNFIGTVGMKDGGTSFSGLDELFHDDDAKRNVAAYIFPKNVRKGDLVILELPVVNFTHLEVLKDFEGVEFNENQQIKFDKLRTEIEYEK